MLLWQCEPKVDSFTPTSGEADFSKFIAIGDSYTAGYTDGALGQRGQMESFAYILSEQLAYVGSESFHQPLVESEGSVGTTVLAPNQNNGYFQLQVANGELAPAPTMGDMSIFTEQVYSAENQNFGIPGAKAIHLGYDGYAQANPFFYRFASNLNTSVLTDALAAQPTFISLWIGNNDALAYALAGGKEGNDAITDPSVFGAVYSQIIQGLTANAKVVVGNIPNVDDIPYFNYILSSGHIPFVIEDEGTIRQLQEGEKVLLAASTLLSMGYGQSLEMPLPGTYVLDAEELAEIDEAITSFNNSIKSIVDSKESIALVDMNSLLKELGKGLIIDGNKYSGEFVTGGIFSLDGIHVTGRGSAIIANSFIEAINKQFGAKIPKANINDYNTVEFP